MDILEVQAVKIISFCTGGTSYFNICHLNMTTPWQQAGPSPQILPWRRAESPNAFSVGSQTLTGPAMVEPVTPYRPMRQERVTLKVVEKHIFLKNHNFVHKLHTMPLYIPKDLE